MSSWFLLAIAAQIAGSTAIYCDKIALTHYVRSTEAVFVVAGAFNLTMGAVLFTIVGLPDISAREAAAVAVAGVCFMLHLLLYFRALFRCSALSTAVLFQLVPVFSLLLSLTTRDGSVTRGVVGATLLIIVGAVAFSIADYTNPSARADDGVTADGDRGVFTALGYMAPASALLAAAGLLLDRANISFGQSISTSLLAAGITAPVVAGMLRFLPRAISEIRQLPRRALAPVIFAESSAFGYQLLTFAALSAGPASYVFAIEGLQPLILLLMGLGIAWLAPRHSTEVFTRRALGTRVLSSAVLLVGVVLLAVKDAS